jgi:hypothetical protein
MDTTNNIRAARRLPLRDHDSWPPVMTRLEAAEMCRVSVHTFDVWVRKGILPRPIQGTRRWSRIGIERALSGGNAERSTDCEQSSPFEDWKRSSAH